MTNAGRPGVTTTRGGRPAALVDAADRALLYAAVHGERFPAYSDVRHEEHARPNPVPPQRGDRRCPTKNR